MNKTKRTLTTTWTQGLNDDFKMMHGIGLSDTEMLWFKIRSFVIDNPNATCKEIYDYFEDEQVTLYDDFSDCKKCSANLTKDMCDQQKQINCKRMVILLEKLEKL